MTKDDEYRGILDEWAQQQLARQRERDTTADQGDNEEREGGMKDEELAAIRRDLDYHPSELPPQEVMAIWNGAWRLLREVERLERENAALREALRDNVMPDPDYPGQWLYGCAVPRDAVEKAREMLAGKGEEDGA